MKPMRWPRPGLGWWLWKWEGKDSFYIHNKNVIMDLPRNGAKCMPDGGGCPVTKSIVLAPWTGPGLSGRGSGWYGAIIAVRATVIN